MRLFLEYQPSRGGPSLATCIVVTYAESLWPLEKGGSSKMVSLFMGPRHVKYGNLFELFFTFFGEGDGFGMSI